jgi:hypothetical protein
MGSSGVTKLARAEALRTRLRSLTRTQLETDPTFCAMPEAAKDFIRRLHERNVRARETADHEITALDRTRDVTALPLVRAELVRQRSRTIIQTERRAASVRLMHPPRKPVPASRRNTRLVAGSRPREAAPSRRCSSRSPPASDSAGGRPPGDDGDEPSDLARPAHAGFVAVRASARPSVPTSDSPRQGRPFLAGRRRSRRDES